MTKPLRHATVTEAYRPEAPIGCEVTHCLGAASGDARGLALYRLASGVLTWLPMATVSEAIAISPPRRSGA